MKRDALGSSSAWARRSRFRLAAVAAACIALVFVTAAGAAAPVAVDDDAVVGINQSAFIDVLGNDSDADGDTLTITGNTAAAHGTADCSSGTECFYMPNTDYFGPDSFDYTVSDGSETDTGTVNVTVTPPCAPAVCIDNDTVLLAVRPEGHLNVEDGSGSPAGPGAVGLHFIPTGNEATAPGCLCEGWGAADAGSNVTGYANVSSDGGANNMTVESFTTTDSTAVSVVNIQDTLRVTHDYHPSPDTSNLYEVTVTIQNITGGSLSDIRYRRVMDWDVEPTAFAEFVTINGGNASQLLFDSNNGFATANPLGGPSDLGLTGDFVDAGPNDHGALFDFGFGALAAGESTSFNIFYGAAADEAGADAAVAASGAEVFSYGQPSSSDPAVGTPNTFIFAFGGVGGDPIFGPTAVDDTLTTNEDTQGMVNVLVNDSDQDGDPLTVVGNTNPSHGTVMCTPAGDCTYTPAPNYNGPDSFEYTISDGTGTATATVNITVTPVNDAPVAVDDSLTTNQDTPGAVNVLANDTDVDGDTLTVAAWTNGAHGTVSCTAAGSCTYTPDAGYSGPDSFTYTNSDGPLNDTGTVNVTVVPVAGEGSVAGKGSFQTGGSFGRVDFQVDASGSGGSFQFTTGNRRKFNSSTVTGFASSANTASFGGTGTWNGAAGHTYEVSFVDNGTPGRNDTISVVVRNPSGAVVFSSGGAKLLKTGNIVVSN
jgi:hypothetical protein